MVHILWYGENMELKHEEEKTPAFYSDSQTEQKHSIWYIVDNYMAKQ